MSIKKVTCYGSGLIGAGWATTFALAGNLEIIVYDVDTTRLEDAKSAVSRELDFLVSEKIMTRDESEEKLSHIRFTSDVEEALKEADFIQENTPEILSIKQTVVAEIEAICPSNAIIASSKSGLLISDIAAKADHPERFVGGHPYNPVYLIPLVEMTSGEKTDKDILQEAYNFYKQIGKEPVILQKEVPGFISNRLQVAVLREAMELVDRGVCTMDEVDRALCYGPGLRMGLMGAHTIFQLTGGKFGIGGAIQHIGSAMSAWFRDMANWTEFPATYQNPEHVQKMMNEVLALRTEEQGRDTEGLMKFRDKGLVTLLKYHGKL